MMKKLTKHGNSLALLIDKPILDLLDIDTDTTLSVTTDGRCLIIAPLGSASRKKRFADAVSEGNRKYGRALKRLAK